MPPKAPPPFSPLLEAAAAFVDELHSYALLSESFQRAQMVSSRHLERINETLGQIAASEERLGARGQALALAVQAAREQQERLARATLDRIPAVKERTAQLQALITRFDGLGREVAALNQAASELARPGDVAGVDESAKKRDLSADIQRLAQAANELKADAQAADFEELANRSHSLHQQLFAAHKKMELAKVG